MTLEDLDDDAQLTAVESAGAGDSVSISALSTALQHVDVGHRQMRRRFARELGLSGTEFRAFMQVGRAVELMPKGLSEQLEMTTGAVTAMIDRLEAVGIIARRPNPADRRSVFLHLSPAGARVFAWIQDSYYETIADAVRTAIGMPTCEVARMLEHLSAAIAAAVDDIGPSPLKDRG